MQMLTASRTGEPAKSRKHSPCAQTVKTAGEQQGKYREEQAMLESRREMNTVLLGCIDRGSEMEG
jgi:hypothetical protein